MKLIEVKISKEALDSLDEREKCFFVQLSNLFHEINALHRMAMFSNTTSAKVDTEVERRAQNAQSFFFLELLAGKLVEGSEMFERDYFGSRLSKDYHEPLSNEGKSSLSKIHRYFKDGDNLIRKVRNQYVFHYSGTSSAQILERVRRFEGEESIYLSEWTSNCFFYLPEMIVTSAMLDSIGSGDEWGALSTFFGETLEVAGWFLEFFKAFTYVLLSKMTVPTTPIEIPKQLTLDDVVLPSFTERPKDARHEK